MNGDFNAVERKVIDTLYGYMSFVHTQATCHGTVSLG